MNIHFDEAIKTAAGGSEEINAASQSPSIYKDVFGERQIGWEDALRLKSALSKYLIGLCVRCMPCRNREMPANIFPPVGPLFPMAPHLLPI
jgi:hypothetical protein